MFIMLYVDFPSLTCIPGVGVRLQNKCFQTASKFFLKECTPTFAISIHIGILKELRSKDPPMYINITCSVAYGTPIAFSP